MCFRHVGTSPQESCSRWGTRAELPETIPWRRIGAAQFGWPLFAQPGLLAGEKFTSPALSLSLFSMYIRRIDISSPGTQLQLSTIVHEPCVSYKTILAPKNPPEHFSSLGLKLPQECVQDFVHILASSG